MKRQAFKYSDIGGRDVNEDTVRYRDTGENFVAVLADGLGGQGDGNLASSCVAESLMSCGADGKLPSKEAIAAAFEKANAELISRQKNKYHMKTTAVYLCIRDNQAVWAHVGDSRLYHIYNGKICHYTLDHSASQMAVYMGQITREEIPGDSGRSRLLRAMGVPNEHADIHEPITLEKGLHFFLLCSDGLWEYLEDEHLLKAAARASTPPASRLAPPANTVQWFVGGLLLPKTLKSPPDCDNNSAIAVVVEI